MLSLDEFNTYLNDTKGLDLLEANKKFLELSTTDQNRWAGIYKKDIQSRLSKFPACCMELDLTHIGFSWRLLNMGHLMKGPHKRLQGKPHGCYENCFALVNGSTSIYTGYALNKGIAVMQNGQMVNAPGWIRHAWLITASKKILETTPHGFSAYFGIKVEPEYLWDLITTGVSEDAARSFSGGDELSDDHSNRERFDFKMPGQH